MLTKFRDRSYGRFPHFLSDLLAAGTVSTLFSGIPSTLCALWSGADPWQALRAAGTLLITADATFPLLVVAAALVHCTISFFWTAVLVLILPPRHIILSSIVCGALIGLLDLCIIGSFFDAISSLPFWPQMMDHILWGGLVGSVLNVRAKVRKPQI